MNKFCEYNRNQYARDTPHENLMAIITHLHRNISLKTVYLFMYAVHLCMCVWHIDLSILTQFKQWV